MNAPLTSEQRCPHGVRHPHPCRLCEDAPLPSNLVSRLRQRLITVPKPDSKPFDMPAAGYFQMGSVGGTHKPGDSAGVLSIFSTCANGGNKLQEHIYAVDPLCEEAATEIERLRPMAESWESYESAQDRKCSAVETSADAKLRAIISAYDDYRGRGVNPAPREYRAVVDAINAARPAVEPSPEPCKHGHTNQGCRECFPLKASETPQHDFRGPTVSCRCGWIGHPNALIGLTCPKCSAEFK